MIVYSNKYIQHSKSLLHIAFPIIVGQVAIIFIGFVDNMMVGQHAIKELSAASFVNNFLNLILIFGLGFSYGLTPLVAEADKLNQRERIGGLLKMSMWLNIIVGLLLSLIVLGLSPFLSLFNLEEELIPIALPYYYLQTASFLILMAFNGFKQFYDGMSRMHWPMYITIVGIILNVLLNYLLIYGKWGFPEWGLLGAGVATLLSRFAMLFIIFITFFCESRWKDIRRAFVTTLWNRLIAKSLIRLGTPVALQLGLEATSFSLIIIFVARLGAMSLAAHQVVMVVTLLGYLIYYGLGAAVAIRVSHFKAIQDYQSVREVVRTSCFIGFLMALGTAVLMFALRNHVSFLFTPEAEVSRLVSIALLPVIIYQFADVLQVIFSNALRGLEQVKRLAPIAFLAHIVVAPALSYLFTFYCAADYPSYQLCAIWSSFPISLTLMSFLLYGYYNKVVRALSR
ncbi:MATE family efflux transporter [Porphyromonas circumdentaria]|uniref:Multidrug-efflux transporter n=1 Tax=Porphyromonas circumdentaria TaxID=29524 RepID=A0A1T4PS77_9PORP|nr:MATE family efflux transporter [Porphyromonas circumdentaria]MBB6276548.1 MATE family multidrug resistance protein [Porphyromonas circumdentaria]MDO4722834.1 MATE family efflux transporter [Porphyromonas circumdentaria]SJZ94494.1 multidrug resistance protein, MATE family [Porphyromonas circumdentaria]